MVYCGWECGVIDVAAVLQTEFLIILLKKCAHDCIMFAQTKKISQLCVIFHKNYLVISTENYNFANVILNTIFYLKRLIPIGEVPLAVK